MQGGSDGLKRDRRWTRIGGVDEFGEHVQRLLAVLACRVRVDTGGGVGHLLAAGADRVPHPGRDLDHRDPCRQQPRREGVAQVVQRERHARALLGWRPYVAVEVADRPELPAWRAEQVAVVGGLDQVGELLGKQRPATTLLAVDDVVAALEAAHQAPVAIHRLVQVDRLVSGSISWAFIANSSPGRQPVSTGAQQHPCCDGLTCAMNARISSGGTARRRTGPVRDRAEDRLGGHAAALPGWRR